MFNALNIGLVKNMRRLAVVAVLGGAALSAHAFTFTYTSPAVTVGGDTTNLPGGTTSTLPKFNPALGTLISATVYTDAKASYSYSATNPETTSEPVSVTISTFSDVVVTDPTSLHIEGQAHASTGESTSTTLGGGNTLASSGSNEDGPSFTAGANLSEFVASGSDTTLTVFQDYFNHDRFTGANLNPLTANLFATSTAYVVYTYSGVPGPAAAGTMLIGLVGGLARRRRRA